MNSIITRPLTDMFKNKSDKFYCFSPPVMIATFAIEVGIIIYTLWRYKLDNVSRLAILIFACLAIFQLAEYQICGGAGLDRARIGFVAITLLPPLGLHLAATIAGKSNRILIISSYLTALGFVILFAFTQAIHHQVCGGNYIIFRLDEMSGTLYGLYYYGWLFVATYLSLHWSSDEKEAPKKKALRALAIGYLVFMVPTTTVNLVNPATVQAIPSIMCGFAVILAVVMVFWVLPAAAKPRVK